MEFPARAVLKRLLCGCVCVFVCVCVCLCARVRVYKTMEPLLTSPQIQPTPPAPAPFAKFGTAVDVTRLHWNTRIRFYQVNPKDRNSEPWTRYESYKGATTVADFIALHPGPYPFTDLDHDFASNHVRILARSPGPLVRAALAAVATTTTPLAITDGQATCAATRVLANKQSATSTVPTTTATDATTDATTNPAKAADADTSAVATTGATTNPTNAADVGAVATATATATTTSSLATADGQVARAATSTLANTTGVPTAPAAKDAVDTEKTSRTRPTSKVPAARRRVCYVCVCVLSGPEVTCCVHMRSHVCPCECGRQPDACVRVYIHVHTCLRGASIHTRDTISPPQTDKHLNAQRTHSVAQAAH